MIVTTNDPIHITVADTNTACITVSTPDPMDVSAGLGGVGNAGEPTTSTQVVNVVGGVPLDVPFSGISRIDDWAIKDSTNTVITDTVVTKITGTTITVCSNVDLNNIQVSVEGVI